MFATFTDWSMDNPEEGVKTAEEIWPEMKAAGAINMRIVKTDDTGARSMTMWPDESTAMKAIDAIRCWMTVILPQPVMPGPSSAVPWRV